jgi:hypothetical protein
MSKSSYFRFSPKFSNSSISVHPDTRVEDDKRTRSDSLEEKTLQNTNILNFSGRMYNAKIVDVDESNIIQIIFKYNNQYNLWKCKLNLKWNVLYDIKLTNIYLKSFINTIQIVKCFIFDKNIFLLIDIVDNERLSSAVTFIREKTNELQNVNRKNTHFVQKICEKTTNCMSEVATSDIIDYDEYIRIIHGSGDSS